VVLGCGGGGKFVRNGGVVVDMEVGRLEEGGCWDVREACGAADACEEGGYWWRVSWRVYKERFARREERT
jgi:hypothetical protein